MPSALVTGGSSGIGFAIARMLRDEGYTLTLAARRVEPLEEAARSLAATAVAVDVRSEEECARLVAAHLDAHGGMDVLVNSAGVGVARPLADTSTKQFDLQQSVNLRGAFLVTREALPALRAARGYVVNLASIAGTIPVPGLASYGAAKAALMSLTRSLVREEAATGVRATAICPAFVDTPMASWTGIDAAELIRPEDCAELVRSLLRLSPAAQVPVVVIERAGDSVV